jgi:hypothetical protein
VAADLLPADRVEMALADWVSRTRPLEQKLEELAALPPRKVMANRAGTEYLFRRLGWPVEIQELERLFTEDPGQLERELAQRRTADPSWVAVFADPPPPPLLALLEKLAIPTIMLDLIDQSGPQNYPDRLGENLKNIEKVALIPF